MPQLCSSPLLHIQMSGVCLYCGLKFDTLSAKFFFIVCLGHLDSCLKLYMLGIVTEALYMRHQCKWCLCEYALVETSDKQFL